MGARVFGFNDSADLPSTAAVAGRLLLPRKCVVCLPTTSFATFRSGFGGYFTRSVLFADGLNRPSCCVDSLTHFFHMLLGVIFRRLVSSHAGRSVVGATLLSLLLALSTLLSTATSFATCRLGSEGISPATASPRRPTSTPPSASSAPSGRAQENWLEGGRMQTALPLAGLMFS